MKCEFFLFVAALSLFSPAAFSENSVSISQIQGLDPARGLKIDYPIVYLLHYQTSDNVIGMNNGFVIYSPDNATWQLPIMMPAVMLSSYFHAPATFVYNASNGFSPDTIGFGTIAIFEPGLEPGFDSTFLVIMTKIPEESIGKTICIDTTKYDVNNFLWGLNDNQTIRPAWGGPYCYTVVDCCVGSRGDVNGDGTGPNILDVTRLVDYLFRGASAPVCKNEADANSDGTPHNIIDLTYLVNWMHRGGPAPGPCPFN